MIKTFLSEEEILARFQSKTILNFTRIDLTSKELLDQISLLLKDKALISSKKVINFDLCNLSSHEFAVLAASFTDDMNHFNLNLGWNHIGLDTDAMLHFSTFLRPELLLQCINLDGNHIGDEGLRHISHFLRGNYHLREISLQQNGIGPVGIGYLAEILSSCGPLLSLNLSSNNIGDSGLDLLSSGLRNSGINIVNLSNCKLGNHGLKSLAAALSVHTCEVKALVLDDNHFEEIGIQALATSLEHNTKLEKLSLVNTGMTHISLSFLSCSLFLNTTLCELNLARLNHSLVSIGEKGGIHIANLLLQNNSLLKINLYWACIGDVGGNALASALKRNSTLEVLNLGGNYISPNVLKKMERSVNTSSMIVRGIEISVNSVWSRRAPSTPLMLNRAKPARENLDVALSLRPLSAHVHGKFRDVIMNSSRTHITRPYSAYTKLRPLSPTKSNVESKEFNENIKDMT